MRNNGKAELISGWELASMIFETALTLDQVATNFNINKFAAKKRLHRAIKSIERAGVEVIRTYNDALTYQIVTCGFGCRKKKSVGISRKVISYKVRDPNWMWKLEKFYEMETEYEEEWADDDGNLLDERTIQEINKY